jgi:hypothetical protein
MARFDLKQLACGIILLGIYFSLLRQSISSQPVPVGLIGLATFPLIGALLGLMWNRIKGMLLGTGIGLSVSIVVYVVYALF